ncbi:MAG: cobalamin-binding protein [Planctomycetota bacterium]|nr:MAG: cobalamin-binding protein [Planctomycetota bacterium]
MHYPERIVCLSEESVEVLYLLGEDRRIVGITGFAMRPPQARKEKPKVSTFTDAKVHEILQLQPDLVVGFSDIQANIAKQLVQEGLTVLIYNQRSLKEIFSMILTLGSLVGATEKALQWLEKTQQNLQTIQKETQQRPIRPKVYFEEWPDPMISTIQWVCELIEIAGGENCFPELGRQKLAKNRIISNPNEVVQKNPDIIIGSWCGKKFRPDQVKQRPGWNKITAVQKNYLFEIKSVYILQPGPAALTDGLQQLKTIIDTWYQQEKKQ